MQLEVMLTWWMCSFHIVRTQVLRAWGCSTPTQKVASGQSQSARPAHSDLHGLWREGRDEGGCTEQWSSPGVSTGRFQNLDDN